MMSSKTVTIFGVITLVWFLGVFALYIARNLHSGTEYLLYGFPAPLKYGLILGTVLGAAVLYGFVKFVIRHFTKTQRIQLSLLHIILGVWLFTLVSSLFVLVYHGVSIDEIMSSLGVIFGSITSVFIFYGVFSMMHIAAGLRMMRIVGVSLQNTLKRYLIAQALAMILTIVFFYVASMLHILSAWLLIPYLIVLIALGLPYYRSLFQKTITGRFRIDTSRKLFFIIQLLILIITLVWFATMFVSVSLPHPVGSDDLRAYYTIPKVFIESGGITTFDYFSFNNAPHGATYLAIPVLFISSYIFNYLNVYFLILLALTIYTYAYSLDGARAGWWAVLLFGSMPLHHGFITTVKVDYVATFFIVLSIFILTTTQHRKRYQWPALAGLFLGIAVAVKYTAIYAVPALLLVLLLWPLSKKITQRAVRLFVFLLFIIVGFSPWGVRNYIEWKNVVYPYSPPQTRIEHRDINSPEASPNLTAFRDIRGRSVHGVSYEQPWYENLFQFSMGRSTYPQNNIGFVFLALIPLLLFGSFKRRLRPLLFFVFGTSIIWYWMSLQQLWYIMFAVSILPVVYALLLGRFNRLIQLVIGGIIIVLFAVTMTTSKTKAVVYLMPRFDSNHAVAQTPLSEIIHFLNSQLRAENPEYVLLNMSDKDFPIAYLTDPHRHLFVQNENFDSMSLLVDSYSGNELLDIFKDSMISHVYYSATSDSYWRDFYCPDPSHADCFETRTRENYEALLPYLTLIYAHDEQKIYEILYDQK